MQGEDGKKGKKKKAADLIELPLDEQLPGSSAADLQRFREEEVSKSNHSFGSCPPARTLTLIFCFVD